MAIYTLVVNGVATNTIEADSQFINTHYDNDGAVLGSFPRGTPFSNGELVVPLIPKPIPKPILPLTNVSIASPANLVGAIYWLQKDTLATISGDVALDDGDYMIIAERVINGSTVVDDARFKATILNGVMSMPINFASVGNYIMSAKRLNEGLNRIGSPVNLSFDSVEFDIHI